jgi:beta-N-acetylhexosaminidase
MLLTAFLVACSAPSKPTPGGETAPPGPSAAASAGTSAGTSALPGGSPTSAATGQASLGPSPTATPSPTVTTPLPTPSSVAASLETLVGQKLVVAMTGLAPSPAILARIRGGQVGGVILFGYNVSTAAQLRSLTSALQAAAVAGRQPPLLIATDQEGGSIKRVSWIPPTLSPPQIGATGDASVARDQGRRTGLALADLGINVDIAPVADLPFSTDSFLYQQGRTFAFDADLNAVLVDAFAAGLAGAGVVPVLKHFPGLGYAEHDTDRIVVTMNITRTGLGPGLRPYQRAAGLHAVMLSNAVYTVFDPVNAAGWSPVLAGDMLRRDIGFSGVSITDSLTGAAAARGVPEASLAVRAAVAGTDLILVTDMQEDATAAVYDALLAAARADRIPLATLRASNDRILALKTKLPVG